MAIPDSEKLDYLYKKVGHKKIKTDVAEDKLLYNESILSVDAPRGDLIWFASDKIPATPAAVTGYVEDKYTTAAQCTANFSSKEPRRSWRTNLQDWISPEFGQQYQVEVYSNNGSYRLYPQGDNNNDEWHFDYASGVLTFIGENLPSSITSTTTGFVRIKGWRYIGPKGTNNYVGDKTTLTTETSATVVDAINELKNRLDTSNTTAGNLANTVDTNNTNINLKVGDLDRLITIDHTDITHAINEVKSQLVNNGKVVSLTRSSGGGGYNSTDTLVSTSSDNDGSGLVISWTGGTGGAVPQDVTIELGGSGYRVGDTITVSAGGNNAIFEVSQITDVSTLDTNAVYVVDGINEVKATADQAILDAAAAQADADTGLVHADVALDRIGNLPDLTTTNKDDLVSAVNEVRETLIGSGPADGVQRSVAGTGYGATGTNVTTTAITGSGSLLTISWTGGTGGAVPETVTITSEGDGYKIGDIIQIDSGNLDARFSITSLSSSSISLSATETQKVILTASNQTVDKPLAILEGSGATEGIQYDNDLVYNADTNTLSVDNITNVSQSIGAGLIEDQSLTFRTLTDNDDNTGFHRDGFGVNFTTGGDPNTKILLRADGTVVAQGLATKNSANIELTNNERTIYVSKNEEYATDAFDQTGRSLNKPFKSIERALFEVAKQSYIAGEGQLGEVPAEQIVTGKEYKIVIAGNTNWTQIGAANSDPGTTFIANSQTPTGTGIAEEVGVDAFEYYTIIVFPGDYDIDNRPGKQETDADFASFFNTASNYNTEEELIENLHKINPPSGGVVVPRGTSIIGLDLRKTILRPQYVPDPATPATPHRFQDAGNLIIYNRDYIQSESFGWLQDNYTAGNQDYNKAKCKRDIGYYLDALVADLQKGGNSNIYDTAKFYYDGAILNPGMIEGTNEVLDTVRTLRIASHMAVMAMRNSSFVTLATTNGTTVTFITPQLGIVPGTIIEGGTGITGSRQIVDVTYDSNGAATSATLDTAVDANQASNTNFTFKAGSFYSIKTPYGESKFESGDLFDPSVPECNDVATAIWTSYDLYVDILNDSVTSTIRRVPYGFDRDQESAIFRVTGGSYFWQLTIKDAINVPQYVNPSGVLTTYNNQNGVDDTGCFPCSHHRLVAFKYANAKELDEYYLKAVRIYNAQTNPDIGEDELTRRIEENRIVGDATSAISIDTVSSASPYIFNCSLRSVYGMGGLHANGDDATGFKSMVLAQYTGISLQRDDRAYLYDPAGNPTYSDRTKIVTNADQRHTKVDSIYLDGWRHYHIKCSNDSFLQVVSVFAVGYADHFISATGSDVSITNSNSNFGNIATLSSGYKRAAFNQDSTGQLIGVVPPRGINYVNAQPVGIGEIDQRTFSSWQNADVADRPKISKIYVKNPNNPYGLFGKDEVPEYIENKGTAEEKRWLLLDGINYLLGKGKNIKFDPITETYETGADFDEYVYTSFPTYIGSAVQKEFRSRLRLKGNVNEDGEICIDADTSQTASDSTVFSVPENDTRQYYGWEYSETQGTVYYGHVVIYVMDTVSESDVFYWGQAGDGSYFEFVDAASFAATQTNAYFGAATPIDSTTENTLLKRITMRYDSNTDYALNTLDSREFGENSSFPSLYAKRTPDNRLQKDHTWRLLYRIPKDQIAKPPERKYVVKLALDQAPYYENSYYIYDVETQVEYQYQQQDGYYLLTISDANVKNILGSTDELPVGYSQNQYFLYPDVNLDKPEWNPKKAYSVYDTTPTIKTVTVDASNLEADGYSRRSEYSTTAETIETLVTYLQSGININSGVSLYTIGSNVGTTVTLSTGTNNLIVGDIIKFCSVGTSSFIDIDTFYRVASSSTNQITFKRLTGGSLIAAGDSTLTGVKFKRINFKSNEPYKKVGGSNVENDIGIDDDLFDDFVVVNETTRNDGSAYSKRMLLFEDQNGLAPITVKLHRPSNIRASGHTWEYVGFGPGNYSTGFPAFQTIVLNKQQTINAQTQELDGGFNGSSGTNSNGDFFIGAQIIDTKGSQSETVNTPKLKTSAQTRLINPNDYLYITAASSSGVGNLEAFSTILQSSARIQLAEASSKTVTYDKVTVADIEVSNVLKLKDGASLELKDAQVAQPNALFRFPVATEDKFGFAKKVSPTQNWGPAAQSVDDVFVTPQGLFQWAYANKLTGSPAPTTWQVYVDDDGNYDAGSLSGGSFVYNLENGVNFTYTPSLSEIDIDNGLLRIGRLSENVLTANLGVSGFIYVSTANTEGTVITGLERIGSTGGNRWYSIKNAWLNTDTGENGIVGDFIINYFIFGTDRILYNVNTFDV